MNASSDSRTPFVVPVSDPARATAEAPADSASRPNFVDLPTVLRLARDRNLDAAIVRERVREAYGKELSARERFLPTLTVGGRFLSHDGRTQDTGGAFLDVTKQSGVLGAVAAAEWEIGEAVYGALAARQRTGSSMASAEAADESAALRAGEAYLDLVRAEAAARVADEATSVSAAILAETEAKVKSGSGFAGDVLRAKAQLAHDTLTGTLAVEARRVAAVRLAEVLDLPSDSDLRAKDPAPIRLALVSVTDPEGDLVREALASRAELRAADLERAAACEESNAARYAPLVPRIGVEGSVGGLGRSFGDLASSDDLRVTLGWRVGPGGLFDTGRIRQADARARIALLDSTRTSARVVREVREAYAVVSERAVACEGTERSLGDAGQALDLYRERLKGGVGLPLEVVVAQDTLTRARLDWIDSTVGYDKAQLRLLHAVGRVAPRRPHVTFGASPKPCSSVDGP